MWIFFWALNPECCWSYFDNLFPPWLDEHALIVRKLHVNWKRFFVSPAVVKRTVLVCYQSRVLLWNGVDICLYIYMPFPPIATHFLESCMHVSRLQVNSSELREGKQSHLYSWFCQIEMQEENLLVSVSWRIYCWNCKAWSGCFFSTVASNTYYTG